MLSQNARELLVDRLQCRLHYLLEIMNSESWGYQEQEAFQEAERVKIELQRLADEEEE